MSTIGELLGSFSPGLREVGANLKQILDEPADRARELLRRRAVETVVASEQGQKAKAAYIREKVGEWGPLLIITVLGGVLAIVLARRA